MISLVSAASKSKCHFPDLPLGTHALASQKAVNSNCATKYLMQPKTPGAKRKGLLLSRFESYKSEEDTLA